ncbi:MAG: ATP phosphoribosyltransferase regulatory subunit [Hyphomicrobiales bacterium]|nr:ATP phosphoribosyltransferase regulatory subunit [Hyphomicrobiales bacterium]
MSALSVDAPRVENVSFALARILQEAGYTPVSTPILQPLEVFLEYAGEDIRKRLYSVADIGGGEHCLRPDLTIPTCRHYLASSNGANGAEARLCYRGDAFRYHSKNSPKPSQFPQVGAEYFGGNNPIEADAEIMALAIDGLRRLGCESFEMEIGDLHLFDALAESIGKISPWGERLRQVFHRSEERFDKLLQLAREDSRPTRRETSGKDDAEPISADMVLGGRSVEEIRARFDERAERRSLPPLPEDIGAMLEKFLCIRAPFPRALKDIRTVAKAIDIAPALERLEQRAECLRKQGIDLKDAVFSAGFGRRLGYYTGFVFEARVGEMQIAAGGRYDHLLQALGSEREIPAVGFAARPDRISALFPEAAGRLEP